MSEANLTHRDVRVADELVRGTTLRKSFKSSSPPRFGGDQGGVDHKSLDVYGLTDTKSQSKTEKKARISKALKYLRASQEKYYETKT